MAVLEKIRKRSVLLFIIIIGALLAFILGDFLSSRYSFFSEPPYAKVGKAAVMRDDLNKQQNLVNANFDNFKANFKASQYPQQFDQRIMDPDFRYNQALTSALMLKMLENEYKNVGIDVTDEFITKFVYSPVFSGTVNQLLQNQIGNNEQVYMLLLQAGILNPYTGIDVAAFRDAINNPAARNLTNDQAAVLAAYYRGMEDEIAEGIKGDLYQSMLTSMVVPNIADAKANFDDESTMASVDMVSVGLATVADKDIEITDADYEAEYNKNKEAYRQPEELREVVYIKVPITVSEADYQLATTEVAGLIVDLASMETVADALANHHGFNQNIETLTKTQIAESVYKDFVNDTVVTNVGDVRELQSTPNSKVIARLNAVKEGYDDVVFSYFQVENEEDAEAKFKDKTVAAIDSVITQLIYQQAEPQSVPFILPNYVDAKQTIANPEQNELYKAIVAAPVGEYQFITDPKTNASYVFVVKNHGVKVPSYEISKFTYDIYPSDNTQQELAQQLRNYIINNSTAEKFANDSTNTYPVNYALVTANSYSIDENGNLPGTRNLVKWAMEAKKGDVSPVFSPTQSYFVPSTEEDYARTNEFFKEESQNYLVALAVLDIYDDYLPVTSHLVKETLTPKVKANKKAETLVAKYEGKGKTASEYAKAMGANVSPMFLSYNGAGMSGMRIGGEAQGAIGAAKKGEIIGPVAGDNAVYVFEVKEVTPGDFYTEDAPKRIKNARIANPTSNLFDVLKGNRKVTNNSLKLLQDADAL